MLGVADVSAVSLSRSPSSRQRDKFTSEELV